MILLDKYIKDMNERTMNCRQNEAKQLQSFKFEGGKYWMNVITNSTKINIKLF